MFPTYSDKSAAGSRAGAGRRDDDVSSQIAEFRDTLGAMADDLCAIAEKRARDVREQAEFGLAATRRQIRRHPASAMGVAAVGGALLALALVPRSRGPAQLRGWAHWSMPASRADLYEMADTVHRSLARAVQPALPIASNLEQVFGAIAKVDPKSSLASMLENAGAWLAGVKDRAAASAERAKEKK